MSSAGEGVDTHQQSTENHSERALPTMADNNDEKREESDTSQSVSDNDVHYATSFKLAAIMVTINLSTMIAALDLVRIQRDASRAGDDDNDADLLHPSGHRGHGHTSHYRRLPFPQQDCLV